MSDLISKIVTFYSYKGGAGRSMALANVACALALVDGSTDGKQVLMIDWDLESPGLHKFFHGRINLNSIVPRGDEPPFTESISDAALEHQPGLIDLFVELEGTCRQFPNDAQGEEFARQLIAGIDFSRFVVPTTVPGLDLMTAGRFDKSYATRVNTFQWEDLYHLSPNLIQVFAERLEKEYRYILIDSRTGLNDTSGICTMLMPTTLVVVFTPNLQSLNGTAELIRRASNYRKNSNDARPLVVFPVASRIELSEQDLKDKWRFGSPSENLVGYQEHFERLFSEIYGLFTCDLTTYFNETIIPHVPFYAYGEEIAVLGLLPADKYSLKVSYVNFAARIAEQLAPWISLDKTSTDIDLAEPTVDEHVTRIAKLFSTPEYLRQSPLGQPLKVVFRGIIGGCSRLLAKLSVELAEDISLDRSVVDQYFLWKRDKRKGHLLRGRKLDWILKDVRRFIIGPDSGDRLLYVHQSVRVRKKRYIVFPAFLLILIFAVLALRYSSHVSAFHDELAQAHLPPDLYERQEQFKSLTIDQAMLRNLDWLRGTNLVEFKLRAPVLSSLRGLESANELRSLELDLDSAPLDSLQEMSGLAKLQSLVLQHIGRGGKQASLGVNKLQELKTLSLDFEGSHVASLPDLTSLRALDSLTLNLRSTSIAELPDLSSLPHLHSVVLFLDGAPTHNLRPLAKLNHLENLTLSLDRTQLRLLSDLNQITTSISLTLFIDSSPFTDLSDISMVRGLRGLNLQMPGTVTAQLPDVGQLRQLQDLTISLTGSDMRSLPDLGRLTDLRSLELNLESSGIVKLPDFSNLRSLEHLDLNLSSSEIENLPDFNQLREVKDLSLLLRESKIRSLRSLGYLNKLQSLTLAISGSQLDDLSSILKLTNLEKLVLYLRWSQVSDLPDLSQLIDLHILELHLEGGWGVEVLPDFSHFQGLTELGLFLKNSQIKQLPDLSHISKLRTVTLNLSNSGIDDLSALSHVTALDSLSLDLQGSVLENLPDLTQLNELRAVSVDIRHSRITDLSQLRSLSKLNELTIDQNSSSLKGLPASVKKLRLGQ